MAVSKWQEINTDSRQPDEHGCIRAEDVRRGDKITVAYGIVTVREVVRDWVSGRVYLIPQEDQPAVGVAYSYPIKMVK